MTRVRTLRLGERSDLSQIANALPFCINVVASLMFTPIRFGRRNMPLAAANLIVVRGTIVWMLLVIWPRHRWVAAAQVPYFVWVSIATVLQLSIMWMNRG